MLLPGLLFAAGLFLVARGGDLFVGAAAWLAEVLGLPKVVVGATVVSVATALPEVLVSLFSALSGSVEMAVGNAAGTVAANAGLVMGIAITCCPARLKPRELAAKAALMLVAAVVLAAFAGGGELGVAPSLLLLALFAAYLAESAHNGRAARARARCLPRPGGRAVAGNAVCFLLGAAGIAVGARLMVDQGLLLAARLALPQAVVGAALMGVGNSIPELATTVAALKRGEVGLSIGNVVGANVIDLTLILPLCALASGKALPISARARTLDLPVLAVIVAAAALPAVLGKRMRRAQGLSLMALYAAYLALLFLRVGN